MGAWIWVAPGVPAPPLEQRPELESSTDMDGLGPALGSGDSALANEVIDTATEPRDEELPTPGVPEAAPLTIKVLGSVEVDPELAPSKRSVVLELACYLALHRRRAVTTEELQIALSRDDDGPETSPKSVRTYMSELRRWLGSDRVPSARGSGYRLADSVTSDWAEFQALVKRVLEDPEEEISALVQALNMVRGRPFDGTKYTWVDSELLVSEMEVAIGAAARRLGEIAAARGEPAGFAFFAGRRAVLACPYDFGLWEMALEGAAGWDPDELAKTWHLARVTLGDDVAALEDVARRLGLL